MPGQIWSRPGIVANTGVRSDAPNECITNRHRRQDKTKQKEYNSLTQAETPVIWGDGKPALHTGRYLVVFHGVYHMTPQHVNHGEDI